MIALFDVIGKIVDMDNFGLPKKEEGESLSKNLKMAAAGAAMLIATGAALENQNESVAEVQAQEHSQEFEKSSIEAGFPARESIPLEAFRAVDEYKSILGETWTLPFVPGADSEQEKMIESIATKHGVSKNDFAQAFRYKVNDAGI